jgi:threonine/homoserine/homoserine lactone efflux protein
LVHLFTQPDHLSMLAGVVALTWLAARSWRSRRVSRARRCTSDD